MMTDGNAVGRILVSALFVIGLLGETMQGRAAAGLETQFANPPSESRMASYWWVFGLAWTKPEIKRELSLFHDAGIGRLLIYPLYPHDVDNPAKGIHNQMYVSPEFLDTLRYAVDTAQEFSPDPPQGAERRHRKLLPGGWRHGHYGGQ